MTDEVTAVMALAAEIEKANPQLDPAPPAEAENREVPDPTDETEADEADETTEESDEHSDDEAADPPEDPEKPQRPKPRRRAQARINELVTQRRDAEALAQQAAQEREYWRQQALQAQSTQQQKPNTEEKTLADFAFDQGAYTEYVVDRRLQVEHDKQRQNYEQQQENQAFAEFGKRADKFRENTPDFEQVALQNPLGPYYPREVVDIIRDSAVGPQLAYYLGQHLDTTDALLRMTPIKQALELGKIEARLEGVTAPRADSPQPPRSNTRAPAVGSIVRAGSSASKSLESMSVKDHIEALQVKRR